MRTSTKLDRLSTRVDTIEQLLDRLDRSLEKIELVTIVREPNTGMSAEAYDGLRKQVIAAVNERMAHLQQLAQFDAAIQSGASGDELDALVREWRGQSQLDVIEDIELTDAFELVGPESAVGRQLVRPAYVDGVTGRVVRAGIIERVDEPASSSGDVESSDAQLAETGRPADALAVGATDSDGAVDEEPTTSGDAR